MKKEKVGSKARFFMGLGWNDESRQNDEVFR